MNAASAPAVSLPSAATPLIGRSRELAELGTLLQESDCRLLTLVGPGGVGKTRLVLEIARQVHMRDGICFVPLQPLQQSDAILPAILDALNLPIAGGMDLHRKLLNYLQEREILLILDNFEHVMDGVGLVQDVLASTPRVKVLVTSRQALNLHAEYVRPLGGLETPQDDDGAPDRLVTYGAVQLFNERARRVRPDFSPEAQVREVVRVCRMVGGLPLALELAAGWSRVLSPQVIAQEIARSIDILATSQRDVPEQHRSMRAVFDHSWSLLSETERAVFSRLSIFRGGFTLDAAERVAGASLSLLTSLYDKSLVQTLGDGRYDLHELLRQYAAEKLDAAGAAESSFDAHSQYFAELADSLVADLKGRRQLEACAEVDADFDNFRAAWIWSVDHMKADRVTQMTDAIEFYCRNRSRHQEREALFLYGEHAFRALEGEQYERLWARLVTRTEPDYEDLGAVYASAMKIAQTYGDTAEIACCLKCLGLHAYIENDYDTAMAQVEESITLYRQLGDSYRIADNLWNRHVLDHRSDMAALQPIRDELLMLRRELGDLNGLGWALSLQAIMEGREGRLDEAGRIWREMISIGETLNNPRQLVSGYAHLSMRVHFLLGDLDQARFFSEEAIRIGTKSDMLDEISWSYATLGVMACLEEDYAEARRLCHHATVHADFDDILHWADAGLALAALGMGDIDAARAALSSAATYLTNVLGVGGRVFSLPIAAIFTSQRGDPVKAAELLGLAFSHPSGTSGWMKHWPLLDRFQRELATALGDEAFATAWKRGQQHDLVSVTDLLLAELSRTENSVQSASNNNLIDPLSQRELEVLTLIAGGLTNREIAARLFIGVSTVKKHIQHIYEKLGTKNRTSTVVRARELSLLP